MNVFKNLHWFIYAIFLLACARQSSPTGGPKDTIPPTLIRAIPPNETINLKAKQIELEFSEDIILNAPKEQLIVTPTIGKDYEISYRRNRVIISLEDPLLDSTTYTFNFRETVQDITEKNPVRNLHLAYSTGPWLDSLSIEGTIFHALTGKPAKDATVALHIENDTFDIMKHPATYFTKTDDQGKFRISHLKPENYFLYAFEDKNRNLVVNSRSESYGFIAEHLYLIEDIKDLSVGLVRLDAGPLKITSARPYNTYFNIRTTKNLRTFSMTASDSSELSYTFGENPANIRVYKTTDLDSVQIRLVALDSIDNLIDTTSYAKYNTREVTPEKFTYSLTNPSLLGHTGQLKATLQFSKPLAEIDFDSIYFQVDSLNRVMLEPLDLTWNGLQRTLTIDKKIDPKLFATESQAPQAGRRRSPAPTATETPANKTFINELHLRDAAFISVEGDSSEANVQQIQPRYPQDLSIINIDIRTEEESYIVQLLDKSQKVVREIKNKQDIRFENVVPGDYQIRLIIDRNNNGRWDPGNYYDRTEPEPIVYYQAADGSTTIKGVKANWEIGGDEMFITY